MAHQLRYIGAWLGRLQQIGQSSMEKSSPIGQKPPVGRVQEQLGVVKMGAIRLLKWIS